MCAQVDGNLVGEVRMLVDRELEEPDTGARLPSWARLVTLDTGGAGGSSDSSPDTDTGDSSCFSFLSMLRPPSVSSTSAANTFKAPQRWRRRHNARQVLIYTLKLSISAPYLLILDITRRF